jgi:hypothetical protein
MLPYKFTIVTKILLSSFTVTLLSNMFIVVHDNESIFVVLITMNITARNKYGFYDVICHTEWK